MSARSHSRMLTRSYVLEDDETVMDHIVMAHIVMAHIVIAHIVMAHIVMARMLSKKVATKPTRRQQRGAPRAPQRCAGYLSGSKPKEPIRGGRSVLPQGVTAGLRCSSRMSGGATCLFGD